MHYTIGGYCLRSQSVILIFVCGDTGDQARASHMLDKHSTTELHPKPAMCNLNFLNIRRFQFSTNINKKTQMAKSYSWQEKKGKVWILFNKILFTPFPQCTSALQASIKAYCAYTAKTVYICLEYIITFKINNLLNIS